MPMNRLALLAAAAALTALAGCDKARTLGGSEGGTGCTTCHGGVDNQTGAPPKAVSGDPSDPAIGAHTAHVVALPVTTSAGCSVCHGANPGHSGHNDDTVQIDLDMSPHYWVGQRECAGKTSIYRGPLLLAYDQRLSSVDPDDLPPISLDGLVLSEARVEAAPAPLLAVAARTDAGSLILCDFASAGVAGNPYRTWLTLRDRSSQVTKP